jgi:hypothetical protein
VTSSVSSDADLVLEGDVGRVADRVGQRAGLGDRAQERADALVGAAQLEDLLDDGAVLALEVAGAPVDRDGRRVPRRPRRAGGRGVGVAAPAMPRITPERETARPPPGSRTRSVTSRDRADLRELRLVTGTSSTRSSSPTSTGSVTSIVGKTTVSSRGRAEERS